MSVRGDAKPRRLRRGHGGGAGEAAGVRRALPGDRRQPRHRGGVLRPRQRRLPAHPADGQRQDGRGPARRWRRSRPRSPTSCSSSAAASAASTATASCAASSPSACSARSSPTPSARSSTPSTRTACSTPARSSIRRRFGENLRLGPETRNREPVTFLDFSREGGIARAAEQCNGQGACRKLDGGMCPSYMVTQDEEHSTRGRANLLRLTFAGVLPPNELTGDRLLRGPRPLRRVQGLQGGVPLRRRHGEAQVRGAGAAQPGPRRAAARAPLRQHRDAEPARQLRRRPLANACRVRAGAGADAALRRHPPRAAAADASRARPSRAGSASAARPLDLGGEPAKRGDVVLFHDTFTDYYHPEVGRAAVRVLEALGYRVVLAASGRAAAAGPRSRRGCCPRRRRWARRNVDALLPYAQRGVPIVGTEPSCLLTFRDEYPDLLRDEASRLVARPDLPPRRADREARRGGPDR